MLLLVTNIIVLLAQKQVSCLFFLKENHNQLIYNKIKSKVFFVKNLHSSEIWDKRD